MSKPQLLWRLELPNTSHYSYVFGTMHVKDIKAFDYQDLVCSKIDESDVFATEINLNQAAEVLSAQSMNLPDGKELSDYYSPKQYQKISRFFTKITGFSLDHFADSQPMQLTNILTGSILSQDKQFSLDEFLWRYAESKDKILLGIETVQEQVDLMHKIPLEFQFKSLYKMAKNETKFRRDLNRMTDIYQSGDLRKILKSAKKSTGGLRKMLIYNRNIIMADRIKQLASEQSIVAAVGAGHLGGKKGVLKLLKDQGVKIKNVHS